MRGDWAEGCIAKWRRERIAATTNAAVNSIICARAKRKAKSAPSRVAGHGGKNRRLAWRGTLRRSGGKKNISIAAAWQHKRQASTYGMRRSLWRNNGGVALATYINAWHSSLANARRRAYSARLQQHRAALARICCVTARHRSSSCNLQQHLSPPTRLGYRASPIFCAVVNTAHRRGASSS